MSDGVAVGLSIAGQHTTTVKSSSDCQECGESLEFVLSGKTLTARKCAFPNGVPFPFEHTLEVPSGRIAFLDRFTFLPEPAGLKRQMNLSASRDSFIAWAKAGFPCASCGNSCPRIYRKGNSILIGSFKSESVPDGYVEVGSIATDYWSWQIGDMQNSSRWRRRLMSLSVRARCSMCNPANTKSSCTRFTRSTRVLTSRQSSLPPDLRRNRIAFWCGT
jgi:hypothetical protein